MFVRRFYIEVCIDRLPSLVRETLTSRKDILVKECELVNLMVMNENLKVIQTFSSDHKNIIDTS